MASFSSSKSVWFTTLLIFLFFWNIFHNSETLTPPHIEEVIEEIPPETTTEADDLSTLYPDPPEPEIYEPELPSDSGTGEDDYYYAKPPDEGFSWKQAKKPTVPSSSNSINIKPPTAIDFSNNQLGVGPDGKPISSPDFIDITPTPPDATLDPTVPVDPIISHNDAHQDTTHAQTSPIATTHSQPHDRPLILYSYTETPTTRTNLEFFLKHGGLQSSSDFIFIFNGPTDNAVLDLFPDPLPVNIRVVRKGGECRDLGMIASVLLGGGSDGGNGGNGRELVRKYKRFVLMNGEVRGPFLPGWSRGCWINGFLGGLNDSVKLVGMSYDCQNGQNQIQSSLWALDSEGIDIILAVGGINECFQTDEAVRVGEARAVALLEEKGYQVDVVAQPEKIASVGKLDGSASKGLGGSGSHEVTSVSSSQEGTGREGLKSAVGGTGQVLGSGKSGAKGQDLGQGASISSSPFKDSGSTNTNGIASSDGSNIAATHTTTPGESSNQGDVTDSSTSGKEDKTTSIAADITTDIDANSPGIISPVLDSTINNTDESTIAETGSSGSTSHTLSSGQSTAGDEGLDLTTTKPPTNEIENSLDTVETSAATTQSSDSVTGNSESLFNPLDDSDPELVSGSSGGSSGSTQLSAGIDTTTQPSISEVDVESAGGISETTLPLQLRSAKFGKRDELLTEIEGVDLGSGSGTGAGSNSGSSSDSSSGSGSKSASVSASGTDPDPDSNSAAHLGSTSNSDSTSSLGSTSDSDSTSASIPDSSSNSGAAVQCTGDYAELHPYATMFVRMDGGVESEVMRKLMLEYEGRGGGSWDVC